MAKGPKTPHGAQLSRGGKAAGTGNQGEGAEGKNKTKPDKKGPAFLDVGVLAAVGPVLL